MPELGLPERRLSGGEFYGGAPKSGGPSLPVRAESAQAVPTRAGMRIGHRLQGLCGVTKRRLERMAGEEMAYGRAVLLAPVCLGAGAVLWFRADVDPPGYALAIGLLVLVVCVLLTRRSSRLLRPTLCGSALVVAGMLLAQFEDYRAATMILDSSVTTTITGKVERREADGTGRWRYILALAETAEPRLGRPPERISMVVRSGSPFGIGETITGRARLAPPSGPALPGLNDFAFSAYFDGIGAVGYFYGAPARGPPAAEPAGGARPWAGAVSEWLYRLRSGIGDRIRSVLPGDAGAFAAALVTDERRAISRETTEALRLSGLAHIIAISGLNMALSAGIFFVGFRSLLSLFPRAAEAYPTKKVAAGGALLAVTAYFLISGFAVSAERAFIMMAIMLVAVFFDRPSLSLRNVALSAIVIIALSPSEVMGPSFQMSFAATLALVAGYAVWKERPARENVLGGSAALRPLAVAAKFFGGIVLTSVIGGISTAIFSIEHFHRLAAYGLAANLAAMPIISFVVMPAGLVAMLLMPFGLDGLPWKLTGLGLDLVIAIAKTVASWGGDVGVGRQPQWFFPTCVAGLLLLTLFRTQFRHGGTILIGAGLLGLAVVPPPPKPDILISEDGGLVAIVLDGALYSNRERPPDFIFGQWQRALAIDQHRPPRIVPATLSIAGDAPGLRRSLTLAEQQAARKSFRAAVGEGKGEGFVCERKAWCTTRLADGRTLTVIEEAAYLGAACDTADIVVTPVRLRLDRCRSGAVLLSAETLRRTGAVEIRLGDATPQIVTAIQTLQRPWRRHRAYDWRSGKFLEAPDAPALSYLSGSGG